MTFALPMNAQAFAPPARPGPLAVTLEVGGSTAGILTVAGGEFTFFAAGRRFAALDSQTFRSIAQAERALHALHRRRGARS